LDLAVFLTTFGLIFVAELGDKTQIAAMLLATRYHWARIFAGIALAFVILNAAAVLVGKALFALLPIWIIQLASGLLFLFFGVMTLRESAAKEEAEEEEAKERKVGGPMMTAFLMILLAELGDKTEIMTATLAAKGSAQLSVFAGSTLALWVVSLLGIFVGRQIARFVPMNVVKKAGGAIFIVFGLVFLAQAVRSWIGV
jgi:putative Ca2+/H+ antiporter (TMEM165/GDT1 family)